MIHDDLFGGSLGLNSFLFRISRHIPPFQITPAPHCHLGHCQMNNEQPRWSLIVIAKQYHMLGAVCTRPLHILIHFLPQTIPHSREY